MQNVAVPLDEGMEIGDVAAATGMTRSEIRKGERRFRSEVKARVNGAAIPDTTGEEDEALLDSISEIGLLQPILTVKGEVADGHRRLAVLEKLGLEPEYRELGDVDARAVSLAANLNRRQLSADARRRAVEEELLFDPSRSDRSVAAALGVSNHMVAAARGRLEESGQIEETKKRTGKNGVPQKTTKAIEPPARSSFDVELRQQATYEQPAFYGSPSLGVYLRFDEWDALGRPETLEVTLKAS